MPESDNDRIRRSFAATEWANDVDVKNGLLHAVEALTGRKAHPYDVACLAGALMNAGLKVVKEAR